MSTSSTFLLNGRVRAVPSAPGWLTLLDDLRDVGLTGAKEGCAEGECGACAVAMVAPHGEGSCYRVVNSCLVPLASVIGREVLTVEGLAEPGRLAPAQTAMVETGGSQCGYCTPGFVVSLWAEQYRPDRRGPCDPLALSGNLCRCTGYRSIRDAALSLGPPPPGPLLDRLAHPTPPLAVVSRDGFSRPGSVEACLALLSTIPGASIVAGATDVAVEANLKGRRFAHLVSLDAIDELTSFEELADRIRIGAALPLSDLGRCWSSAPAAVGEWLELFASPLIRNRATLGGNLVTASPIGDAAPLLLALDASVEIAGAAGRRIVALADLFVGYRQTQLRPAELVTAVEIPKPLPRVLRFYKIAKRRLDDISTVAAAFAVDVDADGRVSRARLALGGVAATPVRARDAEAALVGSRWSAPPIDRVQAALTRTLDPLSDHRGSRAYRLAVSASLVEKFWQESRP